MKDIMKILIVGKGGREDTLAWHARKFGHQANMIAYTSIDDAVNKAKEGRHDLTGVGPEQPLVDGIVDRFYEEGLPIFGPIRKAAILEGSKCFAKELMREYGIPTASFKIADNPVDAYDYTREFIKKYGGAVVKADGLAAGKGVIVCNNELDAFKAVSTIMAERKFGSAGDMVIVEEKLEGEEVSYIAITDGETILPLASSQDHKAVYENEKDRERFVAITGKDHGPIGRNTGGMGAYSPAPIVTDELDKRIMNLIMVPVVKAMKEYGRPFKGVLYAGLMIKEGKPSVLEFNARFGDPETQPLLMRLKSDLTQYMAAAAQGKLHEMPPLEWDPRPAVCIVMASGGYPDDPIKGKKIYGIDDARKMKDVAVFEAGTREDGGITYNSGGRVLGVTALGDDILAAIANAYRAVGKITWEKEYHRTDIGFRAIRR